MMGEENPISDNEVRQQFENPSSAERWRYLHRFLNQPGPFSDDGAGFGSELIEKLGAMKVFNVCDAVMKAAKASRVVLIYSRGAGGLGCEIIKNLALSGFRDIHIIDMDIIDVSNLNRQFLFRDSDVGRPKAEVAAEFVKRRVKDVKITPFVGKIQDKDEDYYMQFSLVICGLDSIEARRWINSMLVGMVDSENQESLKPLIDGGTEGFKGQAKVILPSMTSCVECQLDLHVPRETVPLCTLATIPRQPQHCIEWAHIIAWEAERTNVTLDTDDPEHISWLYQKALKRADEFNIAGVTYAMTQGVVKNIIPAIASTNAIIAASCCNEAFKLASGSVPCLGLPGMNNYMQYTGDEGIYTYTFEHQKKDDCPVCGNLAKTLRISPSLTLGGLMEMLAEMPEAQIKKATIRTESKSLYYQAPASLEEQTRPNLNKQLQELISDGEEIAVSDPAFQINFRFKLLFTA